MGRGIFRRRAHGLRVRGRCRARWARPGSVGGRAGGRHRRRGASSHRCDAPIPVRRSRPSPPSPVRCGQPAVTRLPPGAAASPSWKGLARPRASHRIHRRRERIASPGAADATGLELNSPPRRRSQASDRRSPLEADPMMRRARRSSTFRGKAQARGLGPRQGPEARKMEAGSPPARIALRALRSGHAFLGQASFGGSYRSIRCACFGAPLCWLDDRRGLRRQAIVARDVPRSALQPFAGRAPASTQRQGSAHRHPSKRPRRSLDPRLPFPSLQWR